MVLESSVPVVQVVPRVDRWVNVTLWAIPIITWVLLLYILGNQHNSQWTTLYSGSDLKSLNTIQEYLDRQNIQYEWIHDRILKVDAATLTQMMSPSSPFAGKGIPLVGNVLPRDIFLSSPLAANANRKKS